MKIQINTQSVVNVLNIGDENTPVIYIDDFLLNIDLLKKYAVEKAHFVRESNSSYPGLRATFPQEFLDVISPLIVRPIRQIFQIPENYQEFIARSDYSIITTPAETCRPAQKIPHADSSRIGDFAILFYINDGDFGGTSFYRQKATGIELLTNKNEQRYWQVVNNFIKDYEDNEISFINGSDSHYERIGGIAYKPNRLVIYPTFLLHSGDLTDSCINNKPQTGRLTANVMMFFA